MAGENLPSTGGPPGDADILAALRASGLIEDRGGSEYNRIKIEGAIFRAGDEQYVSNPKTGAPAFIAQIVDVPMELQALWWTPEMIRELDRPDLLAKMGDSGAMCRSHYDNPKEAKEFSETGASCRECPVSPFRKKDSLPAVAQGKKCGWRGEIDLRIYEKNSDDELVMTEPTVWTLSLSMGSMQEWKGFAGSDNPSEGRTGEPHFMMRLARLAMEKWGTDNPIGKMQTALRLGAVYAEVRQIPVRSGDFNYYVTQLVPIVILDVDEAPAIETAETPTDEPAAAADPAPDTTGDPGDGTVPF